MKKLVSIVLAVLLLMMSAVAFADIPEYVNLAGYRPIVKEGTDVKLRVAATQSDSYVTDVENIWFWKFIEEKMNIKLDVEMVLSSAMKDRKPLMLAGGDIPDLMIGFGFTTGELVKYGAVEGLLLDYAPYITPELMPAATKFNEAFPEVIAACTCPDGGVYSIYSRGVDREGPYPRLFIYTPWLEEAGMETPETLDDFTAMLYKFKANHPESVPFAGAEKAQDPRQYILNALGYVTNEAIGLNPAVRNGEAVIPIGDATYVEYLRVLNEYYTNGLISSDFFTMDNTGVYAQVAEGVAGVIAFPAYLAVPEVEDFQKWWAVKPLTSAWNDKQQWCANSRAKTGQFVSSADTKYPEVLARLADYFFTAEGGMYKWPGPMTDSEDALGLAEGWHWVDNGKYAFTGVEQGVFPSNYAYICTRLIPWGDAEAFGYRGDLDHPEWVVQQVMQGVGGQEVTEFVNDLNNGDQHYRASVLENLIPYAVNGYPSPVFFSEEESIAINDLKVVIEDYAKAEVAKFITGARSLDTFDAYIDELKALGFEEYQQYYVDAYAQYLANIG